MPQTKPSIDQGQAKRPLYRNRLFIISLVLMALAVMSYFVPFLVPFRKSFYMYLKTIWWAIALGLFLGGLIDYYIPREYISLLLAKPKKRTVFYAVILGFLMSACSHGILALSIQLHKKGASTPAVIAFLLASPWANITLTFMLIGFFKAKAFFIIISAIVIGIITGLIYQLLEKKGMIEKNKNIIKVANDFSIKDDLKNRIREYRFTGKTLRKDLKGVVEGIVSLSNMVLWWILIGIGFASLIGAYVPTHFFSTYMGPTFLGLLATLLAATIIEVCSEGSAPMAFEIFNKTGAFGNSFVFLMAGVVTDYTEIGLIWHNVGKKAAVWLPVITVPQVILLGFIFNNIF